MGRRKKKAPEIHRETISFAAEHLFLQKGIEVTTMDEIAKEAGYSKATLYVYFKNKEEIVAILVLKSMKKLDDYINSALEKKETIKTRYDLLCYALLQYQQEYPFYFTIVLDEINIDFKNSEYLLEEKETFLIGEKINERIEQFLQEGIESGDFRRDIKIMPTIFSFWGMLSGLIQTAEKKENYIKQELKLSKQEFLAYGFDMLYYSIANREETK